MNTTRLFFVPVFALVLGLCLTAAQDRAFAQDMPPVFKDTTDNPRSDQDQYGKGWPKKNPDPPPQQSQPAPQAELPEDPCAAYMEDYNAYTFCTDRYKKLDRMKAGTERRRATYNPPPPKTEEAKPAEAEKAEDAKKEGEAKPDDKSGGDKGAKEATEDAKKSESEAKK